MDIKKEFQAIVGVYIQDFGTEFRTTYSGKSKYVQHN